MRKWSIEANLTLIGIVVATVVGAATLAGMFLVPEIRELIGLEPKAYVESAASDTPTLVSPTHAQTAMYTATPSSTSLPSADIPRPSRAPVTQVPELTTAVGIPQSVRWGPVDGYEPGICVDNCETTFIPWGELINELEEKLLPQVGKAPSGSTVMVVDWQGRDEWVVQIVSRAGNSIGHIWFGPDPSRDWAFDGLVRVGYPSTPAVVWGVFQRYSDGSYRKK